MILNTHILLIEDDAAVGSSLQTGLEREGYQVTWRQTGNAGIQAAQTFNPHLIILDIRLPDGSGLDFCRHIRTQKLTMPILMLTAQRDELDKILGLEMGADDYMTKPYGLRELFARVRALLRRAYGEFSAGNSDIIYVGDLVIHLAKSEVTRGQTPLPLTPTEFKLLVHFARHPEQALTRSQLLEAVWSYSADIESEKTVNVHIRRLREKVEMNPSQPTLILTVPGVGYRLVG
jgi:DNA-binding response OmpR family regulator